MSKIFLFYLVSVIMYIRRGSEQMKEKKFKFSVVIPVYKVEEYLEETVESVINQSMDFKKNIEIILVNDGSPDNSEEICLRYQEKYPENVFYIKQENAGVSAARNNGLEHAHGKYVNFLDSDDVWDLDVFQKVYRMFENNPEIDLIGVRQKYFEAATNFLSLDFKFQNGDRIIDITKEYQCIHLSVTSGFFRREAIKDVRFDTRIKYSEDGRFIYDVLIANKDKFYGVISTSLHNYRKRDAGNSAIQTKDTKIDWYKQTVQLSYLHLMEKCKKNFPDIIKTIEYYVTYDYQWRLKFDFLKNTSFSEEEKKQYVKDTIELFKQIDDEIIMEQLFLPPIYQMYGLKLKYGSYDKAIEQFFKKSKHHMFSIQRMETDKQYLKIEGDFKYIYNSDMSFYYKVVGTEEYKKIPLEKCLYNSYTNITNDSISSFYVKIEIPLSIQKIQFFMEYKGEKKLVELNFGMWAHLTNHRRTYHNYEKYRVSKTEHELIVNKRSFLGTLKQEFLFQASMALHGKFKNLLLRMGHFITKPFIRKEIWIVSDREMNAGDNGEAIFKYLSTIPNKKRKVYFALKKSSPDIPRMKQYGKVIHFHTYFYNVIFSHCSKVLSAHADPYIYNPLGNGGRYMRDLYHFKYIFLQHGIAVNNLSGWLNRFSKDFQLFITSTEVERDSIIHNENYGYGEEVVKTTGLARYDYLTNDENASKSIMLAPTWRASLVGDNYPGSQKRKYNDNFKKSNFFHFYNELLNDKELLDALKKYGYKIRVCLHPCMEAQIQDFNFESDSIEVVKDIYYSEEFKNNRLLITDYSSVSFDFAYLNKPIIYNKFDEEEFFLGQIYEKGDKDCVQSDFGVVVRSKEDLKKEIIKNLKNDCKLEKEYEDKIQKFFKYHDQNNCKRIYEEILRLDEKDV